MSGSPSQTRQMKLGAVAQTTGAHIAAWLDSDAPMTVGVDFDAYRSLVSTAERGKFHFAFVADTAGVRDWPVTAIARSPHNSFLMEPMTLMAALAVVTSRIGLVCTQSTTFAQPYRIARQFASLDLLSKGRAAWNVVTSTQQTEAANHGQRNLMPHDQRYARAAEFVDVVRGYWGSRDPGVLIGDKDTGLLFDQGKIHVFQHSGNHFSVEGLLNVAPSPQGQPMIVQAGASGSGRDLAANVADIIFCTTPKIEVALDYYADMKTRIREAGRDPESVKITPGFLPIIGRTEEEAREKIARLDALIHPELLRAILSDLLGNLDLSGHSLDEVLPDVETDGGKSRTVAAMIAKLAGEGEMTLRQIAARISAAHTHLRVAGTPDQIADVMEQWFTQRACDGFLIFSLMPGELQLFVDLVVPILQERGLFHHDYEGTTLRENMV